MSQARSTEKAPNFLAPIKRGSEELCPSIPKRFMGRLTIRHPESHLLADPYGIGEINLVILDLIMPGMGGGETFDKLRELNPKVKVLLSSGYSLEGEAAEVMARGCDGFIQKPFDPKTLSEAIHQILDQK